MPLEHEDIREHIPKPATELTPVDFDLISRILNAQRTKEGIITKAGVRIVPGRLSYRQFGQIPPNIHELNIKKTMVDLREREVAFVGPVRYQQLSIENHFFEVFEVSTFGVCYRMLPVLKANDRRLVAIAYLGTEFWPRN